MDHLKELPKCKYESETSVVCSTIIAGCLPLRSKCDTANNLLSTLILLYFVSSLDWPLDLDLATSTNGGLSVQLDL